MYWMNVNPVINLSCEPNVIMLINEVKNKVDLKFKHKHFIVEFLYIYRRFIFIVIDWR